MIDTTILDQVITNAFYSYRFEWTGVNPKHEALSAKSSRGIIAQLRLLVPVLKGVRTPLILAAIDRSQYALLEDDAGVFVERNSKPAAIAG